MKILITSGHTIEKIDSVRHIANLSTGRLGAEIADCFAGHDDVSEICYVCNEGAAKPSANVRVRHVCGIADLDSVISEEISGGGFDAVIHAMAVSDYSVKGVGSLADLMIGDGFEKNSGKIPSDIESLLVLLTPTPKIIAKYRRLGFDGVLVGFKLLDCASEDELVERAYDLLQKNGCNFVLANNQQNLSIEGHVGYLVAPDKSYQKFESKAAIAQGIVGAVIAT